MTYTGVSEKRSVSMPTDLWAVLEKCKETTGATSLSGVIAEAVKEYLNARGYTPENKGDLFALVMEADAAGVPVRELLENGMRAALI